MDVNAMAYCKMSLLSVPGKQGEALVAVPALTKDELVSGRVRGDGTRQIVDVELK